MYLYFSSIDSWYSSILMFDPGIPGILPEFRQEFQEFHPLGIILEFSKNHFSFFLAFSLQKESRILLLLTALGVSLALMGRNHLAYRCLFLHLIVPSAKLWIVIHDFLPCTESFDTAQNAVHHEIRQSDLRTV